MIRRFYFETFIGLLMLIGTFFVGQQSLLALILMALLPSYSKKYFKNLSPNQLNNFYKIYNVSPGLIIIAMFIIFSFSEFDIALGKVKDFWLPLVVSAILMIHGLLGILFFKSQPE